MLKERFPNREVYTSMLVPPTVVLVDGLTRSGKSFMGPVLSSCERVEIERIEPEVEWIPDMQWLGHITADAAAAFLRLTVNRLFYEGLVGRNTNFRFSDHSSVWKTSKKLMYLKRMLRDEREPLFERVKNENPIFQVVVHHQLPHYRLHQQAFGDALRMIQMIRDPVDLIQSWHRKEKGSRIGVDPLISMVFIRAGQGALPWYVSGWEEEYLASSPLDRVIRMVAVKWKLCMEAYRSLTTEERRHLIMVPLEPFVERPDLYMPPILKFVGTRETAETPRILRQNNCPRVYDRRKRDSSLAHFHREAGPIARTALDETIEDHARLLAEIRL